MAGTWASGRRSLSPEVHDIRGTSRADRHEGYDIPEPPPGNPEQPLPLDGLAAGEWDRMLVRLELSGAMSKVDDAALYQYCRLFAETEELSASKSEVKESVARLEESAADSDLETKDRMALYLEIGKMRQLEAGYDNKIRQGRMAQRQWLMEFGLTPAARTRVKLPPKKPESKLDKFRRGA